MFIRWMNTVHFLRIRCKFVIEKKYMLGTVALASVIILSTTACSENHDSHAATTVASSEESKSTDVTEIRDAVQVTPRLESADNFRDVAGDGDGYETADGRHISRGVVYRSNVLTLSEKDLKTVESLNISTILDLRTPSEIRESPDVTVPGAKWINRNILGTESTDSSVSASTTPESATRMMEDTERLMVTDSGLRKQIAATLRDVIDSSGSVIVHCSAGKDRTGWISAVLLKAAGVSDSDVMNNYLLTNDYTKDRIGKYYDAMVEKNGQTAADTMKPLLGVQSSYLQAGLDEVNEKYGSFDSYITDGLGLSDSELNDLRGKLVEG